ncbi:hypothetical protein [Sphingosinicella rhizophila]|uniref:Transporter n=1 Tax=Sphingosinicella rhizophila TaxID=3050082 RepID=A0ABU3Q6E2_9SPHN|nr:hypothetical protein [Sphingosinicella sp. GR2756]MDT9598986.1 hypothetical protein [Sphingosinicella sp. GR2756]
MRKYSSLALATACLSTLTMAEPANAQDNEIELRRQLDEVLIREAESQKRIEDLERRLQSIESRAGMLGYEALSDSEESRIRGRGATGAFTTQTMSDGTVAIVAQNTGQASSPSVQAESGTEEEPDRKTPAPAQSVELVAEQEQGIFNRRLSLEFGLTYTHFDNAQLNLSGFLALDSIFLGTISLDQITSDVFVYDATVRYGITDRLQFDVNAPILFRHSNFQSGGAGGDASGNEEVDVKGKGFGDINFGASYRLMRETVRRPDIVLNARVKAPTGRHPWGVELVEVPGTLENLKVPERLSTGSGVWGASAGVSVLKTIDPMVIFGSVTYFYNFKRHFADLDEADFNQPGSVKIGNALQFGAGVAFALNDRSSLSMSFTQRIVERTALYRDCASCVKQIVVGSQANVGIVNLGANFALTERLAIITNVGIGMTQDAPDMLLSVRVPYRF